MKITNQLITALFQHEKIFLGTLFCILYPKSTIKLPDGTNITIEGSTEEIAKILGFYKNEVDTEVKEKAEARKFSTRTGSKKKTGDVLSLVNAAKNSDDFEQMEKMVLDKSSQVDRVLLPLLVAEREFSGECALTSGDIYEFLKQFGINMALPNVSKTLGKTAQKYTIADKARKKGGDVRYVISRQGKKYIEQILNS